MRLKLLLLSSSLIAMAAIFSYCTKETPVQETVTVATDTKEIGLRAPDAISIQTSGNIDVCGVQNNNNQCGVLNNTNLFGNDFIPSGAIGNYVVDAPTGLMVTPTAANQGQMVVRVKIVTRAGSFEFDVPTNSTRKFTVDANFNVF